MNSAGAFILEQLYDDISFAELTEQILRKYDTDKETAEKILTGFLGMLSGKKLLLDDEGNLIDEGNIITETSCERLKNCSDL